MPRPNPSGWPGGQMAETTHPYFTSAIASRADGGHQLLAANSTAGGLSWFARLGASAVLIQALLALADQAIMKPSGGVNEFCVSKSEQGGERYTDRRRHHRRGALRPIRC